MKMKKMLKAVFTLLVASMTGLMFGCGGGGGGGGTDNLTPDSGSTAQGVNVAGTWEITETMGLNTCGNLIGFWDQYQIDIAQNGNALTLTFPDGVYTGTINGDTVTWSGSYPDATGTVTITDMDITVAPDGQSLSGPASWTWTDGVNSCSGTTSISGRRMSSGDNTGGGGDTTPADISGTWGITEVVGANDCGDAGSFDYNIDIVQNGNSLTVTAPAGTFTGSINGNQISWTGSFSEEGGTTSITGMSITVSEDKSSLNGTSHWSWSDGEFTCSGSSSISGTRL